MQIYVDGVPLTDAGPHSNSPYDLTQLPSPKDIMGIEVYSGAATVPLWLPTGPEAGKLGCGAILVWTEDGSTGL